MVETLIDELSTILAQRKVKNTHYSLRAFARDLELSPAYLSLVLNKKTPLKDEKIKQIIPKIFKDKKTQTYWLNQLKEIPHRFFYKGDIPTYQKVSPKIKIKWVHYAILECFNLKNFESNTQWISKQLGISIEDVERSLDELLTIGALIEKDGKLIHQDISFSIYDGSTDDDKKNLQKNYLQMSQHAIDDFPLSKRDHSSMTIAINEEHISHIKNRIKNFRRELCCELNKLSNNQADQVYQMQFSVFPLTKGEES